MEYSIKVLRSAKLDIMGIANYFDKETLTKKKGDKFILTVDEKINYLKNNYSLFQVRHNNIVRLAHIKKWKYSIHYIVDNDRKRVVVLAVFSMKEDHRKWKERFSNIQPELTK